MKTSTEAILPESPIIHLRKLRILNVKIQKYGVSLLLFTFFILMIICLKHYIILNYNNTNNWFICLKLSTAPPVYLVEYWASGIQSQ